MGAGESSHKKLLLRSFFCHHKTWYSTWCLFMSVLWNASQASLHVRTNGRISMSLTVCSSLYTPVTVNVIMLAVMLAVVVYTWSTVSCSWPICNYVIGYVCMHAGSVVYDISMWRLVISTLARLKRAFSERLLVKSFAWLNQEKRRNVCYSMCLKMRKLRLEVYFIINFNTNVDSSWLVKVSKKKTPTKKINFFQIWNSINHDYLQYNVGVRYY